MNLENTPEYQRGFDAKTSERPDVTKEVCDVSGDDIDPRNERVRLTRHIMECVIAENPYKNMTLEDDVWDAVHRLEEENGLPDGVTADDVYRCYLRVFHHDR